MQHTSGHTALTQTSHMMVALLVGTVVLSGVPASARSADDDAPPWAIVLGRPTSSSVTLNVLPESDMEFCINYGSEPGSYPCCTETLTADAGVPVELVLTGLEAGGQCYYRVQHRPQGGEWEYSQEYACRTQRSHGDEFVFDIVADSHLGTPAQCNPALWDRTLDNVLLDDPDFLLDLGDAFMNSLLEAPDSASVAQLYVDQRSHFGRTCHSVPLFLVLGNHEWESGWRFDGTPDNVPTWACLSRKHYYPNPRPDGFYTGSSIVEDYVGLRENYYSWEWGNALFVVLDPYWYTTEFPIGVDYWRWTLGDVQYFWLEQALEESDAAFKFVFCHHQLGLWRGGVEGFSYFEWGGLNYSDEWEFDFMRPGWARPISQLMADNGVTVFFQGHDHLFAKQEADGVICQTCPMPGDSTYSAGYESYYTCGDVLPNSGHIRVTVTGAEVTVDYVRAYLPGDGTNGEVAYSYTVPATGVEGGAAFAVAALEPNYPNPFNPSTSLRYTVASGGGHAVLAVYDVGGRCVAEFVNAYRSEGTHTIRWDGRDRDGRDVASGVYFCRLDVDGHVHTRKMTLLR